MSSDGKRRYELMFMDLMAVDSSWFDKNSEGWTQQKDIGILRPYDLE